MSKFAGSLRIHSHVEQLWLVAMIGTEESEEPRCSTSPGSAYELAPDVRVNALAPGLVKRKLAAALRETGEERTAAHVPLRRLGLPDDLATVRCTRPPMPPRG